jgi:hypothetical protein
MVGAFVCMVGRRTVVLLLTATSHKRFARRGGGGGGDLESMLQRATRLLHYVDTVVGHLQIDL